METKKIIIVEDDTFTAQLLHSILKRNGFDVCGVFAYGEEACQRAITCLPDLVLMDIDLAGDIDGIEAAEKIREFRDIPIIFLTAYSDDEYLQRAKITVPFGYILKPIDRKS